MGAKREGESWKKVKRGGGHAPSPSGQVRETGRALGVTAMAKRDWLAGCGLILVGVIIGVGLATLEVNAVRRNRTSPPSA
jgi:hypothetical protein